MELDDVVLSRRSIRQFLRKPVSEDIIAAVISKSLWAPSWGNTQGWEIVVGTGKALTEFKERNRAVFLEGKKSLSDVPMPEVWTSSYKQRYKDLGKRVLGSLAIAREDHQGRIEHFARMYSLFDAPALVIFAVDKALSLEYAMLDVGLLVQTFCLLAHDAGLGTCILAAAVNYPDLVRNTFSISEDKRLIIGVAVGWPDADAPVNRFERERGSLEEFVNWVS